MHLKACLPFALCWSIASADLLPRHEDSGTPSSSTGPAPSAITDCHLRGSEVFCSAGGDEYHVQTKSTPTTAVSAQFTGCHAHESDLYCIGPGGEEVLAINESAAKKERDGHDHGHDHSHEEENETSGSGSPRKCHFHAGVEHCTGGSESEAQKSCDATPRKYNVGLRVGLLFVILAASAIGVFGPILLHKIMPKKLNMVFVVLKQCGTGIIVSTAFIHLYTHASLMFANDCVGELEYEGTTSAIMMAGIFLSFVVEYVGQRIVFAKVRTESKSTIKEKRGALFSSEVVSILVMEMGIIFHSLLIGLTLVVTGDSLFLTLFVVIVFHQMFEGIALGTRIATLGECAHDSSLSTTSGEPLASSPDLSENSERKNEGSPDQGSFISTTPLPVVVSTKKKLALAALFAFTTPIGMAIGIGVLNQFNGNNKSTLIAIGTLDALSAGILVWVGVVEMWAGDWMTGSHGHKAELAEADGLTVFFAGLGLVAGLVLMSVLGKWA